MRLQHQYNSAAIAVRDRVRIPLADITAVPLFITFNNLGAEHFALQFGKVPETYPPLVRVHSECLTGDVLGSKRCDCGPQLEESKHRLAQDGGILIYLRQEGRGIGLANKIAAYAAQDRGLDTYAANRALGLPEDARDYGEAAGMLRALGVSRVDLLTNNPAKVEGLRMHGIDVSKVTRTGVFRTPHNAAYLNAKRNVTGHTL